MALSEQLQEMERALKNLLAADEAAIRAEIDHARDHPLVNAEGRDPAGFLAAMLISVEQGCRMFRERLNIPLTACSGVEIELQITDAEGKTISTSHARQVQRRSITE